MKIISHILFYTLMGSGLFAQIRFTDVSVAAGVDHQFRVYEGMFGGGACVFDLNKDGYEDLYITSGMNDDVLYLNQGDGTFRNIFEGSGLELTKSYVTQGVAGADVNRDGWVDLFITTITTKDSTQTIPRAINLLFLNNGDNTFRDATSEFGLDQLYSFSTGANFGDFNADGYPDLYVGNYFLEYDGPLTEINDATIVNASKTAKGYLLLNKKGKYFEDVYEDYGLDHRGFGFGGVFTDYDNDGDQDLLVNHDFGYKAKPNYLLRNNYPEESFTYVEKEENMDLRINAMGAAVGDYDNNGFLDYFVTNIKFNRFMVDGGSGKGYSDKARELGMAIFTISWGANFADFDHDGDQDLFVVNGDLNPNCTPMGNFLFENDGGRFVETGRAAGINDFGVGRGSVIFDLENDGDMDVLFINQQPIKDYPVESRTKLFRNDSTYGNWLKVALKGLEAEPNGIGSRVEVIAGKNRMIREVDGGGSSHLSQNSTMVHFGLGEADTADSVIVTWTGGKRQVLTTQPANQLLVVTEKVEPKSNTALYIGIGIFVFIVYLLVYKKLLSNRTFKTMLVLLFPLHLFAQEKLTTEPAWPSTDWLLDGSPYKAGVFANNHPDELSLSNGLIRRTFQLNPNAATIGIDNLVTGESILRGVKPEATVTIDGTHYPIGGLVGQPNYAFLRPGDLDNLQNDTAAMQLTGYEISEPLAPFEWKRVRHHAPDAAWPPEGIHLRLDFRPPSPSNHINVSVHYELYDGIPVMSKWMTVKNNGPDPIKIDAFTSEIIAAVEYGSAVEAREYLVAKPNIHVETDYAFASFNVDDANHHVVHWEPDPDYNSQVNYLRLTPCLLKVSPEVGPAQVLPPGGSFQSFRTFVLPYDSYERERQGLSLRRMYRTLAPWITENPLMMHARFADWEQVKKAIDQCAEVGFEMVILTFGSGFNMEDDSESYLAQMKRYADYARSRGIEIGGYSLLASRHIDAEQDVVMPEGQKPTFGYSPCICSEWGREYFRKLFAFYPKTGFSLLEHDGSYPGDICISENHPGHMGYLDSRWNQYQTISGFYKWCRSEGIYLNVPDYYYLTGSNKCGMGYREVNWSLPRDQQVLHTRQNIYDGTWTKTPSMGWMFVPLTEYHGGGAAATIEPLNEHLDHYKKMMVSNLGGGVQACYRGPRLFDTEKTRLMVKSAVDWYKKHRDVLEGDLIHLRRADGRDIDYWLNVNPKGEEKGLLMIFNPLDKPLTREINVPLYYTGLTQKALISHADGPDRTVDLARDYSVKLKVTIPAGGYTWYVIK